MSTKDTTPFHIWKHEVQVSAISKGADPGWLQARFGARLQIWYRAGESVTGAVEMIEFTRQQEPKEVRGDNELDHLRQAIRNAKKT